MAILGKVAGPMLRDNLIRNGVDLVIDSNLAYFDVSNRRLGINTVMPRFDLDVRGVINANTIVATTSLVAPNGNNSYPPTAVRGQIRFNTVSSSLEVYTGSVWQAVGTGTGGGGTVSNSYVTSDVFTGDNVTGNFYLTQNSNTQGTLVHVNGVAQIPGRSYTVNGNVLSFQSEVPLDTDIVEARVFGTSITVTEIANHQVHIQAAYSSGQGQINLIADGITPAIQITANTTLINNAILYDKAPTVVGPSIVTIDSFDHTQYRTAKYIITAFTASNSHSVEVLLTHNGIISNLVVYSEVIAGSALITLSTDLLADLVSLYAVSNTANTDIRVGTTYITV
jgi:hypothetical protein